jgi:selenocysteine-specific elongation factor
VHDRFVLRESGRRETVAGGVVLDPSPPRRPGASALDRLARREGAARDDLPALLLQERGAVPVADLRPLTGLDAISGSEPVGRWWVNSALRTEVARSVEEHLRAFHASNPAAEGADAAEARAWITGSLRSAGAPADRDLAEALLDDLVGDGTIARSGRSLRLPAHEGGVADAEVELVVTAVAGGEPVPPTISELRSAGFDLGTIEAAVRTGALVRIAPDLVLTSALVERAVEAVRAAGSAGITVSAVRQAIGTSRKYAVPLMEHLDRTGVTRRSGDLRFARGA